MRWMTWRAISGRPWVWDATVELRRMEAEGRGAAADKRHHARAVQGLVGQCRFTVLNPESNAHSVSALETKLS
jgi:hypothetical protein